MTPIAQDVVILSVAASGDFASTRYALKVCPQCRELNPLMREPAVAILVKGASVAATTAGCEKLRKSGHPGWAKVVRWAVAGFWLGLSANNIALGKSGRRPN